MEINTTVNAVFGGEFICGTLIAKDLGQATIKVPSGSECQIPLSCVYDDKQKALAEYYRQINNQAAISKAV